MSLAKLKAAVKDARSETAEKNAVSKLLGKNPKLRTHKSGRTIMRTYLWQDALNGKSIALVSGPSLDGQLFIVEEATSRTDPNKVLASFPYGKITYVALQGRQNTGLPKRGMRTKTNRRGSAGVRYRSNGGVDCMCKRVNPMQTFNDHREFDTWAKRQSKAGDVVVGMSVLVADGNGNFWLIGKGDKAVPELFDAAEAWVVTGEREASYIAKTDASIARSADKAVGEGFSGLQQTVAQYLGRRYGYKQERSIAKRASFYGGIPQTPVEIVVEKVSEQIQEEANQAVEDVKAQKVSRTVALTAKAKEKALEVFKEDTSPKSVKMLVAEIVKQGHKPIHATKAVKELIQENVLQESFVEKPKGRGRPTTFYSVLGKVEELPSELPTQEQADLVPVTEEAAEVQEDAVEDGAIIMDISSSSQTTTPKKPRKRRTRKPKASTLQADKEAVRMAVFNAGELCSTKIDIKEATGLTPAKMNAAIKSLLANGALKVCYKEEDWFSGRTLYYGLPEQIYTVRPSRFAEPVQDPPLTDVGLEEEDITFESEQEAQEDATPPQAPTQDASSSGIDLASLFSIISF
jgi:hypothetical protein